ncbi:pyridoxamine 5'-phosphate oxidase family protein [Actinomycetospora aeridis]|uniref:Pyridoxamine 5'-phosphate oxidase family protein n=1 Tax=Actinomycetospora aeridis TaxID=3129231 RepID=A0ABU8NDG1_9PSEU
MDQDDVAEVMARPIAHDLLTGPHLARLAYTAPDGDPRVVPVSFLWQPTRVLVHSLPDDVKVRGLARRPRVALTIDTAGWPPRALLLRGTARLEAVEDGPPEEYVAASRKIIPDEGYDAWARNARAMYRRMVRIAVEPDWARLFDFETSHPSSVEDLARAAESVPVPLRDQYRSPAPGPDSVT